MAEVDYLRYAQLLGQRNPTSEGLAQLGETLDSNRRFDLQKQQVLRQNRLADMQIKQGEMALAEQQRNQDYQQGLRGAMANPATRQNPAAQAQMDAYTPEALALDQMNPAQRAFKLQSTQGQEAQKQLDLANTPVQPATIKETPTQAGARFALSQGNLDSYKTIMSADDMLNKYAAQILESGGDPVGYQMAKNKLAQGAEIAKMVKDLGHNQQYIKAMWPTIVKVYPDAAGINPDDLVKTKDGVALPLITAEGIIPNKYVMYGEDGKPQIIDTTPKPDTEALLDKRLTAQAEMQDKSIAAADRRTAAQIAASDRRAERSAIAKENAPGKPLPAGQIGELADMKRVKDVLVEAKDLISTAKPTTGPVAGRLQAIGAKVGMASDDFVNVQQKIQTATNIMLKLRSGGAVTDNELERFTKELPNMNDAPATRDRKMANAVQYASTLMDSKVQMYSEGGYRVPQSATSAPVAKPQKAGATSTPKTATDYLKKWNK